MQETSCLFGDADDIYRIPFTLDGTIVLSILPIIFLHILLYMLLFFYGHELPFCVLILNHPIV